MSFPWSNKMTERDMKERHERGIESKRETASLLEKEPVLRIP
jgi:hypothetical protein